MANLIRQATLNPRLRSTALSIADRIPRLDRMSLVSAFDSFTRRHLRYIEEAEELIQTPDYMLREIEGRGYFYGDCDDAAVLVGSLLATVGVPVEIVAIRPMDSSRFEHVFIVAEMEDGTSVISDPTSMRGMEINDSEYQSMSVKV